MSTKIPIPAEAKALSKLLGTLRHPLRLLMVCELVKGPRFAGDFTAALGTTKSNISQHLTILLRQGLIARTSRGTHNLYRLKDPRMVALMGLLFREFCARPTIPSSLKIPGVSS